MCVCACVYVCVHVCVCVSLSEVPGCQQQLCQMRVCCVCVCVCVFGYPLCLCVCVCMCVCVCLWLSMCPGANIHCVTRSCGCVGACVRVFFDYLCALVPTTPCQMRPFGVEYIIT